MALKQLEKLVLRVESVARDGRCGLERVVSNAAKATPVSSPRHPRALLVMPTDGRGADNERPLRAGRLASFATGAASGLAIFAGRTILSGWSRHGTFPRSANASFTTRVPARKREHVQRFGYPCGRGQQWPAIARPERRMPAATLCGQ